MHKTNRRDFRFVGTLDAVGGGVLFVVRFVVSVIVRVAMVLAREHSSSNPRSDF
jgi:hypothetical protein